MKSIAVKQKKKTQNANAGALISRASKSTHSSVNVSGAVKPTTRQKRSNLGVANIPAPFETDSFLEIVGAGRKTEKFGRGKTIFHQGDPADAVYYIQNGNVRITVVSAQGKEGVIAFLGAGDFFGEGCLSGQPLHIATAATTKDSVVITIGKQNMIRALREDPFFAHVFTTFLLSRSVQVEADLIDHLFNSSEKRLARILLLLANVGHEGALEPVPKISQDVLAARVGTTRSRINFFMNKFRRLGLIEYNGTLKVHSSLLNVIVHD